MTCCLAPYTPEMLRPEALASLLVEWPDAERIDVSGGDYEYWKQFRYRWQAKEDFVIVEHDIVVPEGAAASFEDCPEPYCVYEYPVFAVSVMDPYCLGIVRYRAELTEAKPEVALRPQPWFQLDMAVAYDIVDVAPGVRPHVHGQAEHLHEYSTVRYELDGTGHPQRVGA